jgi:hypothetical protein
VLESNFTFTLIDNTRNCVVPVAPSPVAEIVKVPGEEVFTIAVESEREIIAMPEAGVTPNVNFAAVIVLPSCPIACACTKTESPAITVAVSNFTLTVAVRRVTVMSAVAFSPQVEAVTRTVPGFFAWMTPWSSTVAIVVSEDTNLIGTSVRTPPIRLVAVALTSPTSVSRAGEWTNTTAVAGLIVRLATGLVTLQLNPGPTMSSSVQAAIMTAATIPISVARSA